MKEFHFTKWGNNKILSIGQKVECIYYHEYERSYIKEAYKRTWISRIIDAPFTPVKLGVIVGDAGVHPYWLAANKTTTEQYLFVKFKEYILPKPIPISCIEDALLSGKKTLASLERDKDKIGQKGYSEEVFKALTDNAKKAIDFANS